MRPDYSIGILPVAGTDDLSLTVRQFHAVWKETLRIVDGIRTGPYQLSLPLNTALDSVRYHVTTCLEQIDRFLRTGGSPNDDAFDIPNVHIYIELYLRELLKAKALWNSWISGEAVSFGGVQVDTKTEEAIVDATKPQTISESMIIFAGGVLVIGALWLLKK